VKSIIVCNTDTVARTYTMTVVEFGGSVADNRAIFKDVSIAAKTTHTYFFDDDNLPLADGETINGLADSANKVTVRIGVVEHTY
jgi:hydrogenase maturation factor HypF (carbamoyltransferase family)